MNSEELAERINLICSRFKDPVLITSDGKSNDAHVNYKWL